MLPLEGVRVVEFAHMVMGPSCGLVLADLGAEAITIEPLKGDNTRRLEHAGSGFFPVFNRNKKSLAVDLQQPEGRKIVLKLLSTADVLTENFRPGALDKLGFSYARLKEENPRLIYCSLKGFLPGQESLQRAVDETRVFLLQPGVGEAELVERAGTEVLREDVRGTQQFEDDLPALGLLKIDRQTFLVAVEHRKEARPRMLETARVVAFQRLDLDDLGAEVREHQAARGPHHHVRELDDPHAFERKHRLAARESGLALLDEGRQSSREIGLRGALREGLGLALELRLEARFERAVEERLGARVGRGGPGGEAGRELVGFAFQ